MKFVRNVLISVGGAMQICEPSIGENEVGYVAIILKTQLKNRWHAIILITILNRVSMNSNMHK